MNSLMLAAQQGLARQRLASGQEVSVPQNRFWLLAERSQAHPSSFRFPTLSTSYHQPIPLLDVGGVCNGVARFIQPQLLSERQVPVFAHLEPE